MKKFLTIVIILVFVGYWTATVIFTLPENHISITLHNEGKIFNNLFSQRWLFFAPPPNYNDRVYYFFRSKKDSTTKAFEIIEPINKRKHVNAPFNWNDDVLDYVLSNSSIGLTDQIGEMQEYFKMEKEEGKKLADSTIEKLTVSSIQESYNLKTLLNYSKYVAKNNNIMIDENLVQIRVTKIMIPKYFERNVESIKVNEVLVFQSELLNIK